MELGLGNLVILYFYNLLVSYITASLIITYSNIISIIFQSFNYFLSVKQKIYILPVNRRVPMNFLAGTRGTHELLTSLLVEALVPS